MARITFHALVHEEDDGSYWAEIKELPGCFASGFSLEELREALFEAIQLWLPDGVELSEPQWDLDEKKAAKKRSRGKREAVVCA